MGSEKRSYICIIHLYVKCRGLQIFSQETDCRLKYIRWSITAECHNKEHFCVLYFLLRCLLVQLIKKKNSYWNCSFIVICSANNAILLFYTYFVIGQKVHAHTFKNQFQNKNTIKVTQVSNSTVLISVQHSDHKI